MLKQTPSCELIIDFEFVMMNLATRVQAPDFNTGDYIFLDLFILRFNSVMLSAADDVPVDSEAYVMTSSISRFVLL